MDRWIERIYIYNVNSIILGSDSVITMDSVLKSDEYLGFMVGAFFLKKYLNGIGLNNSGPKALKN